MESRASVPLPESRSSNRNDVHGKPKAGSQFPYLAIKPPKTNMKSKLSLSLFAIIFLVMMTMLSAFHIPHNRHQHPFYIRYRQEQLQQDFVLDESTYSETKYRSEQTTSTIIGNPLESLSHPEEWQVVNATISTPISYDAETGMVQTAVRAIIKHPLSNIVADNHVVGLSSTLVIATGALHEMVDCVQLELTHHATQSTEGLALLSLGHFLHYGREMVRQLAEMHQEENKE